METWAYMNRLQTLIKDRYEKAILHVKLTKNFNNTKIPTENCVQKDPIYPNSFK